MSDDAASQAAADDGETEASAEEAGTADDAGAADAATEKPGPTPQSDALRRQQLAVGVGVSALAGVAVVVATIQQFPGFPLVVYLLFGMAATTLLFGLLLSSLFASVAE